MLLEAPPIAPSNAELAESAKLQGRLPPWIRVKVHTGSNRSDVSELVADMKLNTVCQSAKCPNLAECWHRKAATFMILGNRCTRACGFCAIHSFRPEPVDPDEPRRVAESAQAMGLKYVVITSVDRDDLPDKGAQHFVDTIDTVRATLPQAGIEILTPDFKGRVALVEQVVAARPTVFNHNMETCERLTKPIRSGGRYERSLEVLRAAKAAGDNTMALKSGIMVGLGETNEEVTTTLTDMLAAGVDILTIGQYLPPSREHWPLARYVTPEQFEDWATEALAMGFKAVASSPMVRSSYRSEELAQAALATS
jgi:lipoic acid synthetase